MLSPGEEKELIASVKAGDQKAFGELVRHYQGYVFTLVLQHVSSREVAEELSQDIFVKAWRFLPGFEGRSRFSTWLYTIVSSVCLSYRRSNAIRNELPGDERLESVTGIAPAADPDGRRWQALISSALGRLAPADRQLITLFYQAEQSVQEIATITGFTVSNVKVRLFRARQKLRELLAGTYKEFQG